MVGETKDRCRRAEGTGAGIRQGEAGSLHDSEELNRPGWKPMKAGVVRGFGTATSTVPTARCGPARRVVWEGTRQLDWRPLSRLFTLCARLVGGFRYARRAIRRSS